MESALSISCCWSRVFFQIQTYLRGGHGIYIDIYQILFMISVILDALVIRHPVEIAKNPFSHI